MSRSSKRNGSAYRAAGVDYASLDAGKRQALMQALSTSEFLVTRGGLALDISRGQPAFVFKFDGNAFAFVLEGLGTKSIIARQVAEQLGVDRFRDVAYDTVAAIINDLCCVGALPLVVNAYFATGSSDWYDRSDRLTSLLDGWQQACADAGAAWGGGESPTLPELVTKDEIELAGSAIGVVPDGHEPILGTELTAGDEIVLVASSGLHANGASLARLIAARLPGGYGTELASGATFGEALLEPSIMYAQLVEKVLAAGVPVTYLSHITGHGLLKLMRPTQELTYRITELPKVPEVLEFLVDEAEMSPQAAYSTFNMGAGYAIYCRAGTGAEAVEIAEGLGYEAFVSGQVDEGPRQVTLEEIDVVSSTDELRLSPDS